MLSTKNIDTVLTISKVPSNWIFENYLTLPVSLTGQSLKIKSPLTNEKTPSFKIYYDKNWSCYMFKDYSGGSQGDGTRLLEYLFSITREEAKLKIIKDYNECITNRRITPTIQSITPESSYKVTNFKTRNWNETDSKFWSAFKIPSKLLDHYNIKPLESFVMSKDGYQDLHMKGLIYGYFKNDGTLYKIYLPGRKNKFIWVCDYIQGSEQLLFKSDLLIITSSLKDSLCSLVLLKNIETIAPDSETSYMSKDTIEYYKSKYRFVLTLFDNDEAGLESSNRYKKQYGINSIYLNLSKDVSDSVRDFDLEIVRNYLTSIIRPLLKI